MANGIIRANPIGRFALWDMRTDAGEPDAALGAEYWDLSAGGGVNGSATGAGFTVTLTGATGAANTTANALGAGFTVTLSGATGTASSAGNGNATGAGFEITLTGATGTASGTANGNSAGAAFTVTLTGATGSANATANAIGSGFTVTIGGATGTATGTSGATDGNATGGGFGVVISGVNATAIGTDGTVVVVKSKGAGKKSNKKALTYAERKELDKKVYDALFNIAEEVAIKSDIDKSYVTDNLVADIVNNIDTRDSVYTHRAIVSNQFLEESARLQTVLILEKLREAQEKDDEEALMLLL